MQARTFRAQKCSGLDRYNVPPALGKPFGVSAAAGTDIQHQAWFLWQKRQGAGMDFDEAKGFVGGGKRAEPPVVGGNGVPAHKLPANAPWR